MTSTMMKEKKIERLIALISKPTFTASIINAARS
jgi:hypothetical protein